MLLSSALLAHFQLVLCGFPCQKRFPGDPWQQCLFLLTSWSSSQLCNLPLGSRSTRNLPICLQMPRFSYRLVSHHLLIFLSLRSSFLPTHCMTDLGLSWSMLLHLFDSRPLNWFIHWPGSCIMPIFPPFNFFTLHIIVIMTVPFRVIWP